jgi:isopenicillin-N epimerase
VGAAVTAKEEGKGLRRRDFLVRGGLAAGGVAVAGGAYAAAREFWLDSADAGTQIPREEVEAEFELAGDQVDLTAFLLAPHSRAVREAIEEHRRQLDSRPKQYLFQREVELEQRVHDAVARYLGARVDQVALTDSTTMGLGLVYGTLALAEGDEIVTTEHDHYATHESLRLRAERTGAKVRRIRLYGDIGFVSIDEIVESVVRAIRPTTRAVAVTWVHSSTGLKLPIRALADALAETNRDREESERVLLCVDGVHGLGVEDVDVASLGCDLFMSGCHKWLFGPRGTGLIWGTPDAWGRVSPVIPTFDGRSYIAWIEGRPPFDLPPGAAMTPGGFHSFEHRWALADAFALHERLGRATVAEHTHGLARSLKEGLDALAGVTLVTPLAEELSAGIVCFTLDSMPARDAVDVLEREHSVVASVTPYAEEYVRLGPSIVNTEAHIDRALSAVRALT